MKNSLVTQIYWTRFTHPLFDNQSLHIAASDSGLCLLSLPEDTHMNMKVWVSKKFPGAKLVEDKNRLSPYLKQLEAYCEGKNMSFNLPLDLQGTEFQISVWQALRSIPYGQSRSYLDIAKMINNPHALRAVGAANGANPIPIIIPCHRVIGKDGSLTGYSGGLKVKGTLLQLEGYANYTTTGHDRFNF